MELPPSALHSAGSASAPSAVNGHLMDLGILLLRLSLARFVGHGTQKLFAWFGGSGLTAPPSSSKRSASGPAPQRDRRGSVRVRRAS